MTTYASDPTDKRATADEKRLDAVLHALSNPIRRELLPMLFESAPSARSASELAERLDSTSETLPTDGVDTLLVELHHRHLPMLSDAELIVYDTETRTVTPTVDTDALEVDVHRVLEFPTKDPAEADAIFEALASSRRRQVLRSLAKESHPVTVESVAVDVTRELGSDSSQPVSTGERERVFGQLTHSDLPLLEDVGLIEYDAESGRVAPSTRDGRVNDRNDEDEPLAAVSISSQRSDDDRDETELVRTLL